MRISSVARFASKMYMNAFFKSCQTFTFHKFSSFRSMQKRQVSKITPIFPIKIPAKIEKSCCQCRWCLQYKLHSLEQPLKKHIELNNHLLKTVDISICVTSKTIYFGGPHLFGIKFYFRDICLKTTKREKLTATTFHGKKTNKRSFRS